MRGPGRMGSASREKKALSQFSIKEGGRQPSVTAIEALNSPIALFKLPSYHGASVVGLVSSPGSWVGKLGCRRNRKLIPRVGQRRASVADFAWIHD